MVARSKADFAHRKPRLSGRLAPRIDGVRCRRPKSTGPAVRSVQSSEKLVPQPQADFAFGLRTAKWLPISSSV
jgi:hypothetical protein